MRQKGIWSDVRTVEGWLQLTVRCLELGIELGRGQRNDVECGWEPAMQQTQLNNACRTQSSPYKSHAYCKTLNARRRNAPNTSSTCPRSQPLACSDTSPTLCLTLVGDRYGSLSAESRLRALQGSRRCVECNPVFECRCKRRGDVQSRERVSASQLGAVLPLRTYTRNDASGHGRRCSLRISRVHRESRHHQILTLSS